jgi:predicted phosphate transport protein (TIGR00153 family)
MFAWFQNLLPKTGNFFEQFESHATSLTVTAGALAKLMRGGPDIGTHIRTIEAEEHNADAITREVLHDVRRTFLTPFDRSAITAMISKMDDALDQMQQTAGAVELYTLGTFDPEMVGMADLIVEAAALTSEAMPLLRNVSSNGTRLHQLTARLVALEGEADKLNFTGLRKLYETHGHSDPTRFFIGNELYRHLEKVCDRFEDVANQIDGLVIDHA